MNRSRIIASAFAIGAALAAPAHAGGFVYAGPHGVAVGHYGYGPRYGYVGPCCHGGAVTVGAAAGLAVGIAVASRPAYVAPPAVLYAPPPPVIYTAPPVVYAVPPPATVYVQR